MKTVKIADLKSHLSERLREVRAGQVLTVLDRTTPVARLVPIEGDVDVVVTRPAAGAPAPGRVRLPRPVRSEVDVVRLLLEDRRRR